MESKFLVYIHLSKDTNEPFYVGIGSRKRAYYFRDRSLYWNNFAKKHGVVVSIYKDGCTWEEACEIERELIAKYGRRLYDDGGILVNIAKGGEGSPGVIPNSDTRSKMSAAAKANYPLVKEKLLAGVIGRKMSDEQKRIISLVQSGRTVSQITKDKISKANKGKKRSYELRKQMSEQRRGERNNMFGKSRPEVGARNRQLKSIPVGQFDASGNLLKRFGSIAEASTETGCDESAIIRVCNGKQKTSLGYVWKRL